MSKGELRATVICDPQITDYDRAHLQAYLRLLDAAAAHADWREAAAVILELDVQTDPRRAWTIYEVHLERARWMAKSGYRELLGRPPET